MIAGWLAQAEKVLGLPPDLALALFAVGVVVMGVLVIRKPARWK